MKRKWFATLTFSLTQDRTPEVYDFLWTYLPKILPQAGCKKLRLEINRLEPMNRIYTRLNLPHEEIQAIFRRFCTSRHLRRKASLDAYHDRTSLAAELEVANLAPLFRDYNTLFDLFFADIVIKADSGLLIDLADGFSNMIVVEGTWQQLANFETLTRKYCREPVRFDYSESAQGAPENGNRVTALMHLYTRHELHKMHFFGRRLVRLVAEKETALRKDRARRERLGRFDFFAETLDGKTIGFEVLTRPTEGKLKEKLAYAKGVDEFVFVLPEGSLNTHRRPGKKVFHKQDRSTPLAPVFNNLKLFVWLFDLHEHRFTAKDKFFKVFNVAKTGK